MTIYQEIKFSETAYQASSLKYFIISYNGAKYCPWF
jgi:hypothetical protein